MMHEPRVVVFAKGSRMTRDRRKRWIRAVIICVAATMALVVYVAAAPSSLWRLP